MAEDNTNTLTSGTSEPQSNPNQESQSSVGQVVTPSAAASPKKEKKVKKEEEEEPKKHYAPFWNIIAWIGVILTITAWVVLFYNDITAMLISIPAVICSALGVHSRFRRLSITMLVASGVLLLVFILFWIAIKFLLG